MDLQFFSRSCGDAKLPMHLIFTVPPDRGNFSETALARGSMRRVYYIVAKSGARHAPHRRTSAQEALKNSSYICVIVATSEHERRIWSHFDVVPEERIRALNQFQGNPHNFRGVCVRASLLCIEDVEDVEEGWYLDYYTYIHLHTYTHFKYSNI